MTTTLALSHRRPRRWRLGRLACAAILVALLAHGSATHAATVPPGFADDVQTPTFTNPTNLAFLPDGRYLVTEKRGALYLVNGATRTLIWLRQDRVLDYADRGLLAVVVDPTYPTGRWIYLLYSVDPDSNYTDTEEDNWGRLERYQMAADELSLVLATREVLFGTTWADGALHGSLSHAIGGLAWGRDGTLLVTVGDGAHYGYMDAGGNDLALFQPGMCDPAEDIGAFRARMLQSLNGKVLRLDPATGHGLSSNPFWDGDPSSRRSRVYAYGLRNAFRFSVKSGTGSPDPADGDPGILYYGDVGRDYWEEFGVIRAPGQNMGWPCYEASYPMLDYQAATPAHDGCDAQESPVMPIVTLNHYNGDNSSVPGVISSAVVGGVEYLGPSYPAGYYGGFFVGSFPQGWIKVLKTDANDQFVSLLEFGSGFAGPVAFARHPVTGDIWFSEINFGVTDGGRIHRLHYTSTVGVAPGTPRPRLDLRPPWPNPSAGATRFALDLPAEAELSFEVLDALGRLVWSAPRQRYGPGPAALSWPGTDRAGRPSPNGLYFARARAGGEVATRKFVVAR